MWIRSLPLLSSFVLSYSSSSSFVSCVLWFWRFLPMVSVVRREKGEGWGGRLGLVCSTRLCPPTTTRCPCVCLYERVWA